MFNNTLDLAGSAHKYWQPAGINNPLIYLLLTSNFIFIVLDKFLINFKVVTELKQRENYTPNKTNYKINDLKKGARK